MLNLPKNRHSKIILGRSGNDYRVGTPSKSYLIVTRILKIEILNTSTEVKKQLPATFIPVNFKRQFLMKDQ